MAIKKVVLVGATGAIGAPILKALLEANYDVTAFTRMSSNATFPDSVKVAKVDYNDLKTLTEALEGNEALISTITGTEVAQQKLLVDAAIAAGIKRFIPSEFGGDLEHPKPRALPVFAPKVELEEYVKTKCEGTQTTYTFVYNGPFLDWGLAFDFILDVKNKYANIFDGGDVPFTANPLDFIAKGTVAVLQHLEETANRAVRLNAAVVTQNKLLEIAQRQNGTEGWQITHTDSEELEKQSYDWLKGGKPEDTPKWVFGFIKRTCFGAGQGNDYSGKDDNALLGLEQLSDKQLEELVKAQL